VPLKGVILAGGSGTRLDPLTRITNKHLLPIYDRPMVAHSVQALVDAGLTSLLLVTGGAHVGDFARTLGSGHEYAIEPLTYACQDRAGGIAEALGLAKRFVGGDRALVMLADNLFEQSLKPPIENFARQQRGARVVLSHVPELEHLRHLGVAELDGDRIIRIVEKPVDPPSEYAVTGVYMYDGQVWDVLPTLEPSGRGELEITDVNNWYVERGEMQYDVLEGFWGDAGESIDAYYAVNDFVRQRSSEGG
jgi:glucose-1-phosphate thymidylyltransferase